MRAPLLLLLPCLVACGPQETPLVRATDAAADRPEDSGALNCVDGLTYPISDDFQFSLLTPSNRGTVGLTWVDATTRRRFVAEFDGEGRELPNRLEIAGELGVLHPSLTPAGNGWWVAFHNHWRRGQWAVYLNRVELGTAVDSFVGNSIPVSFPEDPESQRPILETDATGNVNVAYRRNFTLVLARFDSSGTPAERGEVLMGPPLHWARDLLPLDDGGALVTARSTASPEAHQFFLQRFDATGAFVETSIEEPLLASDAALTTDRRNLVLATVTEAAPETLSLRNVDGAGRVGPEILIPLGEQMSDVAIATSPGGFGVILAGSAGPIYLRLALDGEVLVRGALTPGSPRRLSVAPTDDGEFLAAWTDEAVDPPLGHVVRPCGR
ncbi:MAG: hypothetical protein AAGF12_41550 [Myxococcota bacterium]